VTDIYLHESIYRGREAIGALGKVRMALCGAGALGSLIADNLVRQGIRELTVIDFDRVEMHNVGTQLFGQGDIGGYKVDVLRAHCFRVAGVEITTFAKRLDKRTVRKFLRDADLVLDTFDNAASRQIVSDHCRQEGVACLHLGMNADYGEVRWNDDYRVPSDVVEGDVCDYPLARNLILLLVASGCEAVLRFLLEGRKENYSITLKDMKINQEGGL
jgi:molybdopterin/thiamine biosynthesis adenylyltransferase